MVRHLGRGRNLRENHVNHRVAVVVRGMRPRGQERFTVHADGSGRRSGGRGMLRGNDLIQTGERGDGIHAEWGRRLRDIEDVHEQMDGADDVVGVADVGR